MLMARTWKFLICRDGCFSVGCGRLVFWRPNFNFLFQTGLVMKFFLIFQFVVALASVASAESGTDKKYDNQNVWEMWEKIIRGSWDKEESGKKVKDVTKNGEAPHCVAVNASVYCDNGKLYKSPEEAKGTPEEKNVTGLFHSIRISKEEKETSSHKVDDDIFFDDFDYYPPVSD